MEKIELFQNLVNMASIDGKFTDQEVEFLVSRAERWGIANDEFETILVGIRDAGAEFHIPESRADRELLLKELIRMIAADGELASIEKQMLATASAQMEFTSDEFALLVDDVLQGRR
jgi:uncharacterized tellurite resistance protein B-like protein